MNKDFIKNVGSKNFEPATKAVKETLANKVLDLISAKRVDVAKGIIGEDATKK